MPGEDLFGHKPRIIELYGRNTGEDHDWAELVASQACPFSEKRCFKTRKSDPSVSIGTCVVGYGRERNPLIICPNRFRFNKGQVFTDCLHLLTGHRPGNELHVVSEVTVPGGSVDYFLVSALDGKPVDFVGIEFQGLDTTGTVWPHRQEFLARVGIVDAQAADEKSFGVNWKMTAKTTLVQLHHKIETFEAVSRALVLVMQTELLDYMTKEFSFKHLEDARVGDSMQFHPYTFVTKNHKTTLQLGKRKSTNKAGIVEALNLGQSGTVELEDILARLRQKMNERTRWTPV